MHSFVDEPHTAIDGPVQGEIVNLTDRRAEPSRASQLELLSDSVPTVFWANWAYRGRVPSIKCNGKFDAVLLVLLDKATFEAIEIWEAPREKIALPMEAPGSRARNERGSMGIAQFEVDRRKSVAGIGFRRSLLYHRAKNDIFGHARICWMLPYEEIVRVAMLHPAFVR